MIYTHLEMVQLILSAMDSDEVNSISDTVESQQVSLLLRSVYYDCASDLGLVEHETMFELNASGDPAQPTLMTIPTTVINVSSVKYDNKDSVVADLYSKMEEVCFMPFREFLEMQSGLTDYATDVGEMVVTQNTESFPIMYKTNAFPKYFTSTDDRQYIFDSYRSDLDTTLQKSKTLCTGTVYPTYTLSDGFTPDLNPQAFSYLINRAKVRAFAELKQSQNAEAAGEARRQKIVLQKKERITPNTPEIYRIPRYGRSGQWASFGLPKHLLNQGD